jgi:predicted SAM-dependent methyltransferase
MENNSKKEFDAYLKKYAVENGRYKNGVDVGCGTARIDDKIVSIDKQPDWRYAHAQFIWNCKDLELFNNNSLDFIFSSHCLEDFDNIPEVFYNWWKKLKVGGYMLLLLPDMEACDCIICSSEENKKRMKKENRSARYWTIEDYERNGKGNPSHKTNVGKKYINDMLTNLREKDKIRYEIIQEDTIPHNLSCTIDFAIKKI